MIFDGTPGELKDGGSLDEPFYRLTDYGRTPVMDEDIDSHEIVKRDSGNSSETDGGV